MSRTRTKATIKIYSWVPGSKIAKGLNAAVIGSELERLIEQHHQRLEAEALVEIARNPMSPLHPAFEWDDDEAARQYRIDQARHLLRSIQVTIRSPEGRNVTTRMTVTTERPKQPGKRYYSTTEYALSDEELRAEVLKQALRELIAFRRKYAELDELSTVFAVIDRLRKKRR